ncbi:MAG TPA: hypothetical protein GX405_14090 [Rhizobiales bacterium]|nr:hypothetical protein [Hyphomicrobiales bacterium]
MAILLWLAGLITAASAGDCRDDSGPGSWQAAVEQESPGAAKSGEPLVLRWRASPDLAHSCGEAAYLVITFPERVRFSGEVFFVLAPGERGPFGIHYGRDAMRAVIPLQSAEARNGSLELLLYFLGPIEIGWRVVSVSRDTGKETAASADGLLTATVVPGTPRLIVQDVFPTDAPRRVVHSNSGRFRLLVFDGYYVVTDRITRAVVHAAEGNDPAFSPTSRFLHVFGRDRSELRVVDLYAEEVVLHVGQEGWASRGTFVRALDWSPGDAYLVIGFEANGGLAFAPLLADRGHVQGQFSCGACPSWGETYLFLEIENARFLMGGSFEDAAPGSLLHRLTEQTAAPREADVVVRGATVLPVHPDDTPWLLNGPRRSSLNDFNSGRLVRHGEFAPGEAVEADAGRARDFADRGASALRSSGAVNFASRFSRRLTAMGLSYSAALPLDFDVVPFEYMKDDDTDEDAATAADADGEEPGHDYWARTGEAALRRGLIDAAEAAAIDAANRSFSLKEPVCIVSRAKDMHVWSWRVGPRFHQIFQYTCRVGTGYEPEGAIGMVTAEDGRVRIEPLATGALFRDDEPAEDPRPNETLSLQAQQPIRLYRLDDSLVAMVGTEGRIVLFDVARGEVVDEIDGVAGVDVLLEVGFMRDRRHLLQANADGRFFVHDLYSGAVLLWGLFVDDEVVVFDADYRFASTAEGARHAFLKFPGDGHLYSLEQFAATRRSPDLVPSRLAGRAPAPTTPIEIPPRLSVRWDAQPDGGVRLDIEAESSRPLRSLAVYEDGILHATWPLSGVQGRESVTVRPAAHSRWLTLSAIDEQGIVSAPQIVPLAGISSDGGKLFVVAVGTDRYDDPRIVPLGFAVADAKAFAEGISGGSPYYAAVETSIIADSRSLATDLSDRLAAIRAAAGPKDTLFLHIAGHGLLGSDGRLYLADRSTRMDHPQTTAVAWEDIARLLAGIPGRVFVFLDACHSGAANAATNDDVGDVLASSGQPYVVIAASKGRQSSFESQGLGGGAFTAAVMRILVQERTAGDLDGNGTVELSEFYGALKAEVVGATKGLQTPWIARSSFVGEVPLF